MAKASSGAELGALSFGGFPQRAGGLQQPRLWQEPLEPPCLWRVAVSAGLPSCGEDQSQLPPSCATHVLLALQTLGGSWHLEPSPSSDAPFVPGSHRQAEVNAVPDSDLHCEMERPCCSPPACSRGALEEDHPWRPWQASVLALVHGRLQGDSLAGHPLREVLSCSLGTLPKGASPQRLSPPHASATIKKNSSSLNTMEENESKFPLGNVVFLQHGLTLSLLHKMRSLLKKVLKHV